MNRLCKKTLSLALLSPISFYTYLKCSQQNNSQDLATIKLFKNRKQHLQQIQKTKQYDVLVIGGGCNGAGVCLDASTRGLKTLLIEQNDFASGTSSKSTKLIHGGVRYLEQVFAFDTSSLKSRWQKFKLVKQAITERGVMIRNASYMNQKISFVIPCTNSFWSAYYYIGSVVYYLIYWIYSPKNTPAFNFPYFLHRNDLRQYFPYIDDKYQSGVVYQDGCFNDSRMVLMSLLTSTLDRQQYPALPKQHSPANILNQAQFIDFIKDQNGKIIGVKFQDKISNKIYDVKSKYVVNCTGTWADKIRLKDNPQIEKRMRIVGGTHLTYDSKIASRNMGLCIPSKDGRILLVVPWLRRIIAGTTQKQFDQPQSNPIPSKQQRQFIRQQIADVMGKMSSASIINLEISKWAGLRPLVMNSNTKNSKDVARTHVVEKLDSGLYSLLGGKWTTYRKMGEDLVNEIVKQQEKKGRKISQSVSSDVKIIGSCDQKLKDQLNQKYGPRGNYLYHTYGSLWGNMVSNQKDEVVLDTITMHQLKFIIKNEMVNQVQDLLLRRMRVAFLYNKQALMSMVPIATRLISEQRGDKLTNQQMNKKIEQNIQRINSLQFS